MKKVCFVNGSPRGENSASQYFISEMGRWLDKNKAEVEEVCIVTALKKGTPAEEFDKLLDADSIVFVFPLYIDSIPSSMLDFLDRLADYRKNEKQDLAGARKASDVYAVINCGFVEGHQNINAMQIMQHFSTALRLNWRFGVGIGAGEFMRESQAMPMESKIKRKVYEGIIQLIQDIEGSEVILKKNIFTNPQMPKALFMLAGSWHWRSMAGKNKLKRKMLYARPLLQE